MKIQFQIHNMQLCPTKTPPKTPTPCGHENIIYIYIILLHLIAGILDLRCGKELFLDRPHVNKTGQ
jgi:hypothetical protein